MHNSSPPIEHDFSIPEHAIDQYSPLGALAVSHEESRVQMMLEADQSQAVADYTKNYEGLIDPRNYLIKPRALRAIIGLPTIDKPVHNWLVRNHPQESLTDIAFDRQAASLDQMIEMREHTGQSENERIAVRERLSLLDRKSRNTIENYCIEKAPDVLMNAYGSWQLEHPRATVVDWLMEADPYEEAGPLMNFLQWHNHRIEQLNNDPETIARIELQKQSYDDQLRKAVGQGDLPQEALKALSKIPDIHIVVGDVFDLELEGKAGECFQADNLILVAEDATDHVYRHELTHAIFSGMGMAGWDEAVTEQIALILENGDPDMINAHQRGFKDGYVGRLNLLSAELQSGRTRIPFETAARAYMEPGRGSQLEQDMKDMIADSFEMPYEHVYEMASKITIGTLIEVYKSSSEHFHREVKVEIMSQAIRLYGARLKGINHNAKERNVIKSELSPGSDEENAQVEKVLKCLNKKVLAYFDNLDAKKTAEAVFDV